MKPNFEWDECLGDPCGDPQDAIYPERRWHYKDVYKPRYCATKGCPYVAVEGWQCAKDKRIYCAICTGEMTL